MRTVKWYVHLTKTLLESRNKASNEGGSFRVWSSCVYVEGNWSENGMRVGHWSFCELWRSQRVHVLAASTVVLDPPSELAKDIKPSSYTGVQRLDA